MQDDDLPKALERLEKEIPRSKDGLNFTKAQVAFVIGVNERTLRRWHELGEGPRRDPARARPTYPIHEVERWLRTGEQVAVVPDLPSDVVARVKGMGAVVEMLDKLAPGDDAYMAQVMSGCDWRHVLGRKPEK